MRPQTMATDLFRPESGASFQHTQVGTASECLPWLLLTLARCHWLHQLLPGRPHQLHPELPAALARLCIHGSLTCHWECYSSWCTPYVAAVGQGELDMSAAAEVQNIALQSARAWTNAAALASLAQAMLAPLLLLAYIHVLPLAMRRSTPSTKPPLCVRAAVSAVFVFVCVGVFCLLLVSFAVCCCVGRAPAVLSVLCVCCCLACLLLLCLFNLTISSALLFRQSLTCRSCM